MPPTRVPFSVSHQPPSRFLTPSVSSQLRNVFFFKKAFRIVSPFLAAWTCLQARSSSVPEDEKLCNNEEEHGSSLGK